MSVTESYQFNIGYLHQLRGLLIARRRDDVTWQGIAAEADLSPNTISGIVNGRSAGSLDTRRKLLAYFNANGVPALYEELLDPIKT